MAQAAHDAVMARCVAGHVTDKYESTARGFPSYLHTCGLAQTVAFFEAKKGENKHLLEDLAKVLVAANALSATQDFADRARNAPTAEYILLHSQAIEAAVWIKRYAESFGLPKQADGPASTLIDGRP